MQDALDFARAHGGRFVDELVELLRIPSISTDSAYTGDVAQTADWLVDHLRQLGATSAEANVTQGHPDCYSQLSGRWSAPDCTGVWSL